MSATCPSLRGRLVEPVEAVETPRFGTLSGGNHSHPAGDLDGETEMSTVVSLPPFQLDARIAESPLVSMRFVLNNRAGDLENAISTIEADIAESGDRRRRLRMQLMGWDDRRRSLLAEHRTCDREALLQSFARTEAVLVELTMVEEELGGLRERLAGLRAECSVVREISAALESMDELRHASLDDPGAKYSQASRELMNLVTDAHEAIAQNLLAGPLDRLADAALAVELVGRTAADAEGLLEGVVHCKGMARDALDDMQRVLFRLHPSELEDRGVVASLRRLVAEQGAGRLQVLGEERRLEPAVELALFRIVEEAVDNAVRHGHAGTIDIILSYGRDRVVTLVKDDGEGFDVVATEARLGRTKALGLIAMRQRAELAGGSLQVRSLIGAGTEVRATFSYRAG